MGANEITINSLSELQLIQLAKKVVILSFYIDLVKVHIQQLEDV